MPDMFRSPSSGVRYGRSGSVAITLFAEHVEAQDLDAPGEHIVSEGIRSSSLVVVTELKLNASPEVREAAARLTERTAELTAAQATVLNFGGLKGSFIRSVMTGIHMVQRDTVPRKVFSEVDEALGWLAREDSSAQIERAEVHATIEQLSA